MPARTWRVVGEPSPGGAYKQLREVANALGVQWSGAPELKVRIDGTPVRFDLDINSGTVVGVEVRVAFEGPPRANAALQIELRRETDQDREGKARGITREVQTGIAGFDHAVFIDENTSEGDVKRLLASDETRAAVLRLLDSRCRAVRISGLEVKGSWSMSDDVFPAERLLQAAEDLLVVRRAGAPSEAGPGRRGWALVIGAVVLGSLSPVALAFALVAWTTYAWFAVLGVVLGVVLGRLARPLLARAVAGDAGSFTRYRVASGFTSFGAWWLVPALLVALNGGLDRSPGVARLGTVEHVGAADDESSTVEVTVKWDDGTTSDEDFPELGAGSVAAGDRVSQRRHPGLLVGWWEDAVRASTY